MNKARSKRDIVVGARPSARALKMLDFHEKQRKMKPGTFIAELLEAAVEYDSTLKGRAFFPIRIVSADKDQQDIEGALADISAARKRRG